MKRFAILTFMAALLVATTSPATAQKHRHHPAQQTTAIADSTADSTADKGIEAFSDTTSAPDTDAVPAKTATYTVSFDDDSSTARDMLDLWATTIGFGVGGIILAIIIVLAIFLVCLAPFIIIALIIRMLINRHNDNVGLAAATATAQPQQQQQQQPQQQQPQQQTDMIYREKGVKNTSIGAGVFLMGWIIGSTTIAAIGVLVVCYGIGLLYLSRKQGGNNSQNP